MKLVFLLLYLATITGCTSTNSLNSKWKESIAQLQITPVMPLRENLHVGEVYRYLKKPDKYYADGQVEPTMAFRLDIPAANLEHGNRVWPTFSFTGGSTSSFSAASEAAGILSANLTTEDTLTLTVSKGFSKRISASSIISELCDVEVENGRHVLKVKKKYHPQLQLMSGLKWKVFGREFKRNVVYLRIPTEVYYAEEINVTAKKNRSGGGTIEIPEVSQLTSVNSNIEVAINSDTTVSLVEKFPAPMAIGYRGSLLRVWINGMSVDEFPEDAGLNWWSDL